MDCFPLESVLAAINVTTVDFFSLDVEGHEYEILKNIPFDRIHIKVSTFKAYSFAYTYLVQLHACM